MSNLLDGLNGIIADNDSSVKQVIQSILFFDKNIVEMQALDVKQRIEQGTSIPVRYNSNQHFYRQGEGRRTTPPFKNKKEALKETKENPLFHKETDIRICFDSDGNYVTKKDIFKYTGHSVTGEKRTIINYNISHIWGKTDNPLFFSLMWNYCLVPAPYGFLTDRNDAISLRVQDLIKAISIRLYEPNRFLKNWKVSLEMPPQEALEEAERLIKNQAIQFVPMNNQSI
jgi:hypothetical protein